jgi:cytoskeletal protein RodZ
MSVGEKLANERRKQGRALAEVESATKIMGRMLDALEHDRWEDLPAPVYVKGYITSYAQFLHLDPAPFIEEYLQDTGKAPEWTPIRQIPERTVVPHRSQVHAIPRRVWTTVAVAVLVVLVIVWAISALGGGEDQPTVPPAVTTATPDATQTVPGVVDTPTVDTEAPGGAQGEGFVLAVSVTSGQSSWLRVTVDGLTAYEGVLPGGTTKEWTVTDEATVRIGKPGSVAVTRDGQPVEVPMGGGIAEVSLTAQQ